MKSEGWAAVINLARTGGPRRRAEIMLSAWTLVAAYAHGKPPQAVIADVTNHGPIPFQIVFGGSEANVTSTLTHGNGNGDAGREPAQVPGAGPTG